MSARPRRSPSLPRPRAAAILLPFLAAALLGGCNTGDEDDDGGSSPVSSGITAMFTPDVSNACPRPAGERDDVVSMQMGTSSGSLLSVDVFLTDCDASLSVSGFAFEVSFSAAVADFVGCSAGPLLASGQLAPGTPSCRVSGGNVLGTVALRPPQTLRVGGGGVGGLVRLTFNVKQKGANSPLGFVGTDSVSSSSLYVFETTTNAFVGVPIGASGYEAGAIVSN